MTRRKTKPPEVVVIKLECAVIRTPVEDLFRRARNGDLEADREIRQRLGGR